MIEMITLSRPGLHAQVAARTVTRHAYKSWLQVTAQSISPALARADIPSAPVTYVSQVDAAAYCLFLRQQAGRPYRLPSVAELLELADQMTPSDESPEVWPHYHSHRPELRGGLKETYLCEWTSETEETPQYGSQRPQRVLGSVFYPPWLREGNNEAHAQAYLLATEGYSFVTFRVACDPAP